MLDMQNVAIRFGKGPEAVADTSFHVDRQKRTVVIGETGSGKSVLLLAILGLLPQSARVSGKILFEGQDLLSLKERQMERIRGARIAYIPQGSGNGLNPLYTIGRQIDETIRKHSHVSRVEARRRTVALLERFGIEDAQRRAKAYPFEYSGGMRQRALIAMGIAANAQMILADEPTKGLDRCRIQAVIDAFHQLEGRTLLCVTHDLRLAEIFSRSPCIPIRRPCCLRCPKTGSRPIWALHRQGWMHARNVRATFWTAAPIKQRDAYRCRRCLRSQTGER